MTTDKSLASLLYQTRRHFLSRCSMGLGAMALGTLAARENGSASMPTVDNPMRPKPGHFPARAKNVIFLFMAGGPSQLDMFEHKPQLDALNGKPIPESFTKGKRFAFMNSSHRTDLLATRRSFAQHGETGTWVSDLLPHTASMIDDLTLVTTCKTDLFNHAPAKLFMNAGSVCSDGPAWALGSRTVWEASVKTCPDSWCCKAGLAAHAAERRCGAAVFCRRRFRAFRSGIRVIRSSIFPLPKRSRRRSSASWSTRSAP